MLEIVVEPELAGSQRFRHMPSNVVFEGISSAQALHSHMFLAQIAVKRRGPGNSGVQILNVIGRSNHGGTVSFFDAHVVNFHGLCRTLILKSEHPVTLNAGIGLKMNARSCFLCRCAIVLK